MEIGEGFRVAIESGSDRFWRYNVAVTCGCFDAHDARIDFAGVEDIVAPAGSNLAARPDGYPEHRRIEFVTPPCHHILMYVYIIPHTMPGERDIADCKPFDLRIRVSRGKVAVFDKICPVNSWAGSSIELRLPKEE